MALHPSGQFPAGVKGNYFAYAASAKKTPYIAVMFETDAGTITKYMYLSSGALEYSKKDLMTCGWDGQNIERLASERDMLAGNTVWITVAHENNQDNTKKRAIVEYVNAQEYVPGDANAQEMPTELARTLNLTGNPTKKEPIAGAKDKNVDGAYDKDDEIPF